ncbi:MAG: 2-C-methyl-D-erythritol 4-phosphate cytidylyltransferase [Rhodothermales bacterium]|nr:2-C-methyl-D-erythritol 4-phosphate cytidylyltransferase [Rhodothermales bacterium]
MAVIIPAAGSGTRLGGHRKQFRDLGGKPVIVQTLLAFERHPEIHQIIVVAPESAAKPLSHEFRQVGISKLERVVPGGSTRQESVLAGIEALPPLVELVLVHDAVRPFVRQSQITAVIEAVKRTGAAAPAIEVVDTLRRASGGVFGETVDRSGLFRMQTPQGFSRELLTRAHTQESDLRDATDDVGLVQRLGESVALVAGSSDNIKITTPDDWERATGFWPTWESVLSREGIETVGGQA